jgi:hypothetical protein
MLLVHEANGAMPNASEFSRLMIGKAPVQGKLLQADKK